MNKQERINYLNKKLNEKESFVYCGPEVLYKYRPFDEHTFKMLETGTLFLCSASKLDDETECDVSIDMSDLYELKTNNLKRKCVDRIIDSLKDFCSEEVIDEVKGIVNQVVLRDGKVRNNFLLDIEPELKRLAPEVDTVRLINCIASIPEQLDKPTIRPQMEQLISLAISAKKEMGICSLSESGDIDYMWENYADNYSGYCIEYEMNGYKPEGDIFPVIYDAKRETNIVNTIVDNFINQVIAKITHQQLKTDTSQFLRLFISKYPKWEYQNEWRIIGNANTTPLAPKIKQIFIGSNASEGNANKIIDYCKLHNIPYTRK